MPEPVAELTLALLGNPASFEKMMAGAEARLDKFIQAVDAKGGKIQASMDAMLGKVGASAGKMDAALQPVVSAFGDVAVSASVAKDQVAEASQELRGVKAPADQAASALKGVGTTATTVGKDVKSGMDVTAGAVSGARQKLEGFAAFVGKLRSSAKTPIVQRVVVQQTGGRAVTAERSGGAGREGLTSAGYGLMTAGGAILGAEAAMIKSGEGTEDALRRLYATAGETQNYETLRREVLGIATEFGQMPEAVAKALYPIESLGFKGAAGLTVLRAAAAMAKGTQADLGITSELVAKTLNLYGQGAEHAGHLTDVFTVAIKDAVVPGKDFVPAYSGVMTIAKNAGLSVEETAAALAVMTHNAKSASVGATQLRAFISGVITPTKAMRDAAKAAGLEWLATGHGADELKRVGLAGVLDEIMRATNGNVSALGDLLPDMRKNQAAMALLNNGGQVFTRTLKDVQNAQGATAKASQAMDQSLAQSGRNMDAALGAASSNLEDAMKPALLALYTGATNLINAFNRLSPLTQKAVGGIAGVTGGVMLLAGAGLVVTRWVLSVTDLFARFAVRGVAANAEVAASATETAVAEESIGASGEASAAQLQAAATGMMTANEEVAATAEGAADAEAGVGTAATGAAAAGVAAFAVGAAWFVGIAAAVALVAGLAYEWYLVKQAQDDAAKAQQRFNAAASEMQAQGGQAAMMGTRAKVLSESTDLTDAIQTANNDPVNVTQFQKNMEIREQLKLKGYDTSNHSYNSQDGAEARIKALDASADKLSEAILQAHKDGVNVSTKAAHAAGADGFALAVANVDPTSIQTKLSESCAEYVSKVFQKAGLNIPVIPGAKALRDKILAMGGQAHGGPALPGDLVVYHGGRMGTKAGGGYHVGVATGDGTDWESSRGKTKQESIAGNLKWSGPGTTVEYITVPGSTFSSPPAGAAAAAGAEPAWAKHLHDGKGKKTPAPSAGSLKDIDLSRIPSVATLPADLQSAATNAQTFEAKLQGLTEAFAEHNLKLKETVPGYDELAAKTAYYGQRLTLTNNALKNTQSEIDRLTPKTQKDAAAVKSAAAAYNVYADKLKAVKAGGGKLTAGNVQEVGALRTAYQSAKDRQAQDDAALKENQRVHHAAVQSKIQDLDELGRVRDEQARKETEYERTLKSLQAKTDRLAPKSDFDQRRQDAHDEAGDAVGQAAAKRKSGDYNDAQLSSVLGAILAGEAAEVKKIDAEELKDRRKTADEIDKIALETGQLSEAAYRDKLVSALAAAQAEFGETSLEAAKLSLEMARIDWKGTEDQVEALRQKFDAGDVTLKDYIADLKQLNTLTNSAAGHKQIQDTIDGATKQQTHQQQEAAKEAERKSEEQIQKITDKATGMVMQIVHHAKTLQDVFRDTFADIENTIIENFVKQTIAKIVGMVLSSNQALGGLGRGAGGGGTGSGSASGLLGLASSFVGGAGSGPSGGLGGIGSVLGGGGLGGIFGVAAKALPMVGALLAGASLLGHLFGPDKHTPTTTQSQQYANVLTTFSPTVNSGFSGTDGLRDLLGNTTRAAAAGGNAPAQAAPQVNITIAADAFNGVADPVGHANILLQQVQTGLAKATALDNASRGNR